LPATSLANAQDLQAAIDGKLKESVGINSTWVIVAGAWSCSCRRASRSWRSGSRAEERRDRRGEDPHELLHRRDLLGVCGFAIAFSAPKWLGFIGHTGFFLSDYGDPLKTFPVMGTSDATIEAKFFFQFVFCAVSLAIVWGTTLERIKFGVYIIYATVFSALIYPMAAGAVFGGGFLQEGHWLGTSIAGMQDFAGFEPPST
jgi:Amt family ammonium transporter